MADIPKRHPRKKDSVSFPLVRPGRKRIYYIMTWTLYGCGFAIIPGGFYVVNHHDAPMWFRIILVITFVLGVVLTVVRKLITAHTEFGKITFSPEEILVEISGRKLSIPASGIMEIRLQYKGYEGEQYYASRRFDSFHTGLENFIQIRTARFEARDEILIRSQVQMNVLHRLLSGYAQNGAKVTDNMDGRALKTLQQIIRDVAGPF